MLCVIVEFWHSLRWLAKLFRAVHVCMVCLFYTCTSIVTDIMWAMLVNPLPPSLPLSLSPPSLSLSNHRDNGIHPALSSRAVTCAGCEMWSVEEGRGRRGDEWRCDSAPGMWFHAGQPWVVESALVVDWPVESKVQVPMFVYVCVYVCICMYAKVTKQNWTRQPKLNYIIILKS